MVHLISLDVPAELAADLASRIDESGGLLATILAVALAARALVSSLHDKAWLKLDGDICYIQIAAGGGHGVHLRPGGL